LGDNAWRQEWYDLNELRAKHFDTNIPEDSNSVTTTGVGRKLLEEIGAQIFRIPPGFAAHKKVSAHEMPNICQCVKSTTDCILVSGRSYHE